MSSFIHSTNTHTHGTRSVPCGIETNWAGSLTSLSSGSRRAVTQGQLAKALRCTRSDSPHGVTERGGAGTANPPGPVGRKEERREEDLGHFALPATCRALGLHSFPSAGPRRVPVSEMFQLLPQGRHRSPVSVGRRSNDAEKTEDDKHSQ